MKRQKAGKSKDAELDVVEEEPAVEVEEVVEDPFDDLRYKFPPEVPPSPEYIPKTKKVDVYRLSASRATSSRQSRPSASSKPRKSFATVATTFLQRRSVLRPSGEGGKRSRASTITVAPCYKRLNKNILIPEQLTVWDKPFGKTTSPRSPVFIRKPPEEDLNLKANLCDSLRRESKSLELHRKTKKDQLRVETDTMDRSGKSRESLLLRRQQVLPKISPNSLEKSAIPVERCKTPCTFPDWVLWAPLIYGIEEKNGITCQLNKRQKGYDVIEDWMGYPEITDEVRTELGLNKGHISSCFKQNDFDEVSTHQIDGQCLPTFPRLGVLGFNYRKLQNALRLPKNETIVVENDKRTTRQIRFSTLLASGKQTQKAITNPSSMASLTLGHVKLFWSTDPQRSYMKYVVELGCSADIGQYAMDYVIMKNTGTTSINYNWVKRERKDEIQNELRDEMRLMFDNWGGVILPGDVYRIPFMYKALTTGNFSVDWQLLTQPVLENGGEIILRLWGFTRQCDRNLSKRDRINDILKHQISLSIAKQIVEKLMDNLPLGESTLSDSQFFFQLMGAELFVSNNPWLHYHSSHVRRLGKIEMLMSKELKSMESKKQTRRHVVEDYNEPSEMMSSSQEELKKLRASCSDEINLETEYSEASLGDNISSENLEESVSQVLISFRKEINKMISEEDAERMRKLELVSENPEEEIVDDLNRLTSEKSDINEGKESNMKQSEMKKENQTQLENVTDAYNVTDPNNLVVQSMRQDMLSCNTNLPRQEALFALLYEEISSLSFKPFFPCKNWKIPLVKGLFSTAMETFVEFALKLEDACYQGEHIQCVNQQRLILEAANRQSAGSEYSADIDVSSYSPPNKAAVPSDVGDVLSRGVSISSEEDEGPSHPRYNLQTDRYKNQYYGRLYTRMYWLLSDVFDQMDRLVFEPAQMNPKYGKEQFIKIDKIPMNIDITKQVNNPLPPRWIQIYRRMYDKKE